MSSESDDDLLALAGADSETEDEMPAKRLKSESASPKPAPQSPEEDEGEDNDDEPPEQAQDVVPYPLQGKFKDMNDRDRILALPELERETILFDRAEEMRNYKERLYLRRRAQEQQQPKEVPAARSTRSGTSSRLKELKKARQARQQQESDYSESEGDDSEEDEEIADASEVDEYQEGEVEWADEEKADELTVDDINAARWGKSQLAKYCHYPDFSSVIRGCFVRVSIGFDAKLQQNAYIVGQVVGLEKSDVYAFGNGRKVDEKVLVTYAGSEQAIEMGSCSDSNATQKEFEAWKSEMDAKDLSLPSKRRLQQKAKETVAEQTRNLTSEEITEMVARRQALSGPVGSNFVLQRSALEEQREAAVDAGDEKKVAEIDAKLAELDINRRYSKPAQSKSALESLSERNRKSNLHSVRRAELQAQVDRRKSGSVLKADPFSRLRTNAKLFYDNKNDAPVAQVEEPEKSGQEQVSMSVLDATLAAIDIKLRIVI